MDPDLEVNGRQLARFCRALDESLTSLGEARRALEHVRADQLGTAALDEACDGFQKRWKYGAEQLDDRITSVRDGVQATRAGFAEVERAIETAFRAVAVRHG
ncbi:hypothetical protein HW130_01570 [Streptomyces sp. PKU-EA00015]|uniref:hypothetical protein n=1 Tax=Streptomyces sp. PKU-EA00015 TaxID=2748326 RepID=UPI0015A36473|nr:hypothetical protein [Streptomyces sp. PKU-EA00015]NWF24959.1 hypothetical protein [Streptomyces sp. PKU-EA00015]